MIKEERFINSEYYVVLIICQAALHACLCMYGMCMCIYSQ